MPSYATQCEQVVRSMGIKTLCSTKEDDLLVLSFEYMNDDFDTRFIIDINESAQKVAIYSSPPWKMPRARFPNALHFITLINYEITYGSLDINFRDGGVRYKTTAAFGTAQNIVPIIQHYMNRHFASGKKYLQGLTAIKENDVDVDTAMGVAGVETSSGSRSTSTDLLLSLPALSMKVVKLSDEERKYEL